jgi:hypothetical protein
MIGGVLADQVHDRFTALMKLPRHSGCPIDATQARVARRIVPAPCRKIDLRVSQRAENSALRRTMTDLGCSDPKILARDAAGMIAVGATESAIRDEIFAVSASRSRRRS